ncbi:MAG: hypothetical protein QOI38_3115 [Sphingomonadales bacterium]|jgi:hypothetical protein|nr:hypothetical protein [Sphingomonadales bacterium]
MRSKLSLRATAILLLSTPLAGCVHTAIANDVPRCDELVPASLLAPTHPADIPEARQLPDGHDDAQPWQVGFVEQTGQLERANERLAAVDHIYRTCLELHRRALERSQRGFFRRLLSSGETRARLAAMSSADRQSALRRIEVHQGEVRRQLAEVGGSARPAP